MTDRGTFETSTDVRYMAAFGLAGNFFWIFSIAFVQKRS
jgi:hypothetical protein